LSPAEPPEMILRSTLTSPFGRKVRMTAEVLGLVGRIRLVPADTLDPADSLRAENPLGKMPCLILADGTPLYDSKVIVEYLDCLSPQRKLIPAEGLARFRTLTAAALADGIAEAALLMVYEGRFRDPAQVSRRWLDHQRGKVLRGLAVFETVPPDPQVTDVAAIALACALGYLDWRRPVAWRDSHPALVAWLDAFAGHEPAFAATLAPDTALTTLGTTA